MVRQLRLAKWPALITVLLAAASISTIARGAGEVYFWAKAGAKADDFEAVFRACKGPLPQSSHLCLHQHGWRRVKPTSDQLVALGTANDDDARKRWYDALLASPEVAAQLAEQAKLPTIPEFDPDPLTYAGLLFDPDAFTPAPGNVPVNGIVLHGPVRQWRTARVAGRVPLPDMAGNDLAPGTVLHAVYATDGYNEEYMYWCGSAEKSALLACVRNDERGFVVAEARGRAWLPTSLQLENQAVRPDLPIKLEPVSQEQGDPLTFSISVRKIDSGSIELEGALQYAGAEEVIWRVITAWSSDGHTIVPFWSRQLIFTKQPDGVSVAFGKSTDGRPLTDGHPIN